jgi:hypothetical protein
VPVMASQTLASKCILSCWMLHRTQGTAKFAGSDFGLMTSSESPREPGAGLRLWLR